MLGGGEPSGDHGAAAGPSGAQEDGGSGPVAAAASAMFGSTSNNNNSGEDDKGRVDDSGGGFGGNRWPRQETLALLKIRSDMDVAFRDASIKGPLWDEVSRKLAELGYHRSAKKCKEKFENVYKYHKRTKEGRTGKQDGKAYRFFDQLEALETQHSISSPPAAAAAAAPPRLVPTTMPPNPPSSLHHVTVPSTTTSSFPQNIVTTTPLIPSSNPTIQQPLQMANPISHPPQLFSHNISSADLMSNSTSSSTSSDIELGGRHKRKRKWKDFFQRLMREVMEKQEEMQKKFLEAIEKREHERMVREEAWRMQEMTRISREREILAQERSLAAAKDTAVMTFLQKLSEQQNPGQLVQNHPPQAPPIPSQQPAVVAPAPAPPPQRTPTSVQPLLSIIASAPVPPPPPPPPPAVTNLDLSNIDNGGQNSPAVSSSRWPKVEIEALIELRTNLDAKYQENGPKGPLWEEISAGMKRLGYNRNAKRCKEKWENINKYFKKVKESNKKRPEDSKTCPYFHQLDALYRKKNKVDSSSQIKPENSVPLMVRPEQQWPPPPPPSSEPENQHDSVVEEIESEHEDDKDGDDEEEDEGGEYEIVASKPVSLGTSE